MLTPIRTAARPTKKNKVSPGPKSTPLLPHLLVPHPTTTSHLRLPPSLPHHRTPPLAPPRQLIWAEAALPRQRHVPASHPGYTASVSHRGRAPPPPPPTPHPDPHFRSGRLLRLRSGRRGLQRGTGSGFGRRHHRSPPDSCESCTRLLPHASQPPPPTAATCVAADCTSVAADDECYNVQPPPPPHLPCAWVSRRGPQPAWRRTGRSQASPLCPRRAALLPLQSMRPPPCSAPGARGRAVDAPVQFTDADHPHLLSQAPPVRSLLRLDRRRRPPTFRWMLVVLFSNLRRGCAFVVEDVRPCRS